MATIIPSSNVEAAYEDMFKEITRKLYGEETGNGLHTLGTPVAQVATSGPTAPEGERSFTNLIDRSVAPTIEYEHSGGVVAAGGGGGGGNVVVPSETSVVVATSGVGNFKTEDQLSTAFGLAALMQNGFTTTGTILNTQNLNKNPPTSDAGGNNVVQQQQQQQQVDPQQQQQRWTATAATTSSGAEEIVQWTTGGKLASYNVATSVATSGTQKPSGKSKNRHDTTSGGGAELYPSSTTVTVVTNNQQQQTTATSVVSSGSSGSSNGRKKNSSSVNVAANATNSNNNNTNNNNTNNQSTTMQIQKRYACTHCPYSTDRRDLYTRHENIHKDEKPFQCYACLKQFNRADHVKKHFLRMHREMVYDINKTRRNIHCNTTSNATSIAAAASTSAAAAAAAAAASSVVSATLQNVDQKPNIFLQPANVQQQINDAFLVGQQQQQQQQQRQEPTTSSSFSIAQTIESVATATDVPLPQLKQEKNLDDATTSTVVKVKREKRFTCCYCPWSGADKWGLKRHLNTHTKPFVCMLCDYKAARSERLATHVLKVHNKKACNKCSFLADNQEEYQAHLNEVHGGIGASASSSSGAGGVGNNTTTNVNINSSGGAGAGSVTIYTTTTSADNNSNMNGINVGGGPLQEIIVNPTSMVGWRLSANGSLIPPHDLLTGGLPGAASQKRGSERLFQYLEADGSDPEDYARLLKMDALSRNTASVAQDFRKAGGVELKQHHQLLYNQLPSKLTKEAAVSFNQSFYNIKNNNNNNNNNNINDKHLDYRKSKLIKIENGVEHSTTTTTTTNDNDSLLSSPSLSASDVKPNQPLNDETLSVIDQRKAMSAFLRRNFDLLEVVTKSEQQQQQQQKQPTQIRQSFRNRKRKIHYYHHQEQQQQQQIESPPANKNMKQTKKSTKINNNNNNNNTNHKNKNYIINSENQKPNGRHSMIRTTQQIHQNHHQSQHFNNSSSRGHRHNLIRDKENSNSIFSEMEYQNLSKISVQFQNYVKDIINKYYSETPLLFPSPPPTTNMIISPRQQPHESQHHQSQQQQQQQQQLHYQHHQQQQQTSPNNKRQKILSETEEYIEYLKNKEDITLTITPKVKTMNSQIKQPNHYKSINNINNKLHKDNPPDVVIKRQSSQKNQNKIPISIPKLSPLPLPSLPTPPPPPPPQCSTITTTIIPPAPSTITTTFDNNKRRISNLETLLPLLASAAAAVEAETYTNNMEEPLDFSQNKNRNRKQAQPKKIKTPPEVVIAMLRDKYLNRMVDRKKSCAICTNSAKKSMLVFPYHTSGSLALHRLWKHTERAKRCHHCDVKLQKTYSLKVHYRRKHAFPRNDLSRADG